MNRRDRLQRFALVATVAAVLCVTFAAYLRPDMMTALALQVWNCF